jgi:hypothetical protein
MRHSAKEYAESLLSDSGNQTWQWKIPIIDHFHLKPQCRGDFPLRSLITRGIQSAIVELCATFKPPTVRFTKPAPCHGENSVFGELAMVLNISKAFSLHIPSTFFPRRLRECHPLQLHIFASFNIILIKQRFGTDTLDTFCTASQSFP